MANILSIRINKNLHKTATIRTLRTHSRRPLASPSHLPSAVIGVAGIVVEMETIVAFPDLGAHGGGCESEEDECWLHGRGGVAMVREVEMGFLLILLWFS